MLEGTFGLYIDELIEVDGVRLAFHSAMNDPWWNFAIANENSTANDILQLKPHFAKRGHPITVLVPYANGLSKALGEVGFTSFSQDTWLTAAAADIANLPIPQDVEIAVLDEPAADQIESFCNVNAAAFDSGDPNDPYADADHAGFRRALEAALAQNADKITFLQVFKSGEPAGVAQVIVTDDWGGLYGGAVVPQLRGQGIGTAMLASRAQIAIERGASRLFLQTELDERPHKLFEKRGFSAAFIAQLMIKR